MNEKLQEELDEVILFQKSELIFPVSWLTKNKLKTVGSCVDAITKSFCYSDLARVLMDVILT